MIASRIRIKIFLILIPIFGEKKGQKNVKIFEQRFWLFFLAFEPKIFVKLADHTEVFFDGLLMLRE